ncbi:6-carboxyhexanoate--CoA ligase [Sulfurihydrogenibium sp.]|uniref:6-carboxyhexanoate--CoA ligase n=1 Tax=Sulfurihydrogenibium sp. TaxID=2053621 RepID=UPI00260A95F1|nr:6-carboxyhexanoate--CoA ligase [Sulfurihydrogenibium sp.]
MREYYSIKMRATLEEKHISGAERITTKDKINSVITQLLERPSYYDFMNIKVQKISEIQFIEKSLNIKTIKTNDYQHANQLAIEILKNQGIPQEVSTSCINLIHHGASPDGGNMRGAMIVNIEGERLEKDKSRGIRTVNVDFEDREKVTKTLLEKGYTERTVDALALATKNLNHPDILAEYCISDQPDYTTGYVAVKGFYYRITHLKKYGNPKGGRIYFVKNNTDIEKLYEYLQSKAFLIKELGDLE